MSVDPPAEVMAVQIFDSIQPRCILRTLVTGFARRDHMVMGVLWTGWRRIEECSARNSILPERFSVYSGASTIWENPETQSYY